MENLTQLRQLHLDKADYYLQLNNYSSALAEYEKVKSLIKDDEPDYKLHKLKSLDGISWTKARMGKYSESLKVCNETIAYAFLNKLLLSKFFTVRGCCYKELGNPILAERSFELASVNQVFLDRIITEEGDESLSSGFTALGFNAIGNRYFQHNMIREALASYEKAIEINPSYANGHFNRGVVLANCNNHDAAIQAYSRAINLDPNYADAYLNRGNSFCYIHDFKSAIDDYTTCLIIDPSSELAAENREYAKSLFIQSSLYK